MKREIFEINVRMPYDFKESMKLPRDFTIVLVNSPKNSVFSVNLSIIKSSSITISQYEAKNPDKKFYTIESGKLSHDEISMFLKFSYGGKISINNQSNDHIKKIATYFNSPLLLEKSFAFVKCMKNLKNTIALVNDQMNVDKYLKLIAQHFYLFRISQLLNECDISLILQILMMPNLCDNSEESICLFLMEHLAQIKENQPISVDINELLCSIRSETFSESFCQYLVANFGSNKNYLLPLIQRRLVYDKEHDSLPSRVYQINDIEICIDQFLQDFLKIT